MFYRSPCATGSFATAAFWLMLSTTGPVFAAPPEEPAATAAPAPLVDDTKTSAVIPLGQVEARGKRSLFDEQAARRKKLLDESAPCLGCDAKPIVHHPKLLERIANSALNQVTPQSAPEPDQAGSVEHEIIGESRHPTNSTP